MGVHVGTFTAESGLTAAADGAVQAVAQAAVPTPLGRLSPAATIARYQSFDGQTGGATITTGNSAASGDPFGFVQIGTSCTATYITDSFRGSSAARYSSNATAAQTFGEWGTGGTGIGLTSTLPVYIRLRVRFPTLPADATGVPFCVLTDSAGAFQGDWRVKSTGAVVLRSGAGVVLATSTTTIAANQWLDVGLAVTVVSGTAGAVQAVIYGSDGVTIVETLDGSGIDTLRSGGTQKIQSGLARTLATQTVDIDDLAFSTSGYPGLPINATNASAEDAAAAFTGYDASAQAAATAEQPTTALTGYDAATTSGANAEQPSAAFIAQDASTAVTVQAEQPAAALTALDAMGGTGGNAEQPAAAFTAYDATVSTTSQTNAPAESTTAVFAGYDAAAATGGNAEQPAATLTGYDAATAVGIPAGQPTAAFTALDASPAATANAEQPTATFTGYDATPAVAVAAGQPTAAFTAYDATVSTITAVSAPAETTAAAFTGYDALASLATQAESATAAFTALDAAPAVAFAAGQPSAAFTAYDATVSTGTIPPAGLGSAAFTAYDASTQLATQGPVVAVAFTAYDATAVTISSVKQFVTIEGGPGATGTASAEGVAAVRGMVDAGPVGQYGTLG